MMAGESFGFAAYRSRQQTAALESALKKQGIRCRIINTPHELGMGCGLSVRFELNDLKLVRSVCDKLNQNALIGIYVGDYTDGKLVCRPAARMMRCGN